MNVSFLEQRSGLRKTLKSNDSASIVLKGLVIRNRLWVHLKGLFPQLIDEIDHYASNASFKTKYDIDDNGMKSTIETTSDGLDDESENANGSDEEAGKKEGDASSYKSRQAIVQFCRSLAKNKFERSLGRMAKESQASASTLDLSLDKAKFLVTQIQHMEAFLLICSASSSRWGC